VRERKREKEREREKELEREKIVSWFYQICGRPAKNVSRILPNLHGHPQRERKRYWSKILS